MNGADIFDTYLAPYWATVNVQAEGAAQLNPEPFLEPFIPSIVPDSTPPADPQVAYPGQGAVALWNDVWHYSKSILSYFGRSGGGVAYVTTDMLNSAVDDTLRSTINALGGFISTAHQLADDVQSWAQMEFNALDANIGAIYAYFDGRLGALENLGKYVTEFAFPLVEDQLATLRHDMNLADQFVSGADRAWATDHILHPLEETIFNVAADVPVQVEHGLEAAKNYADMRVGVLGIAVLGALQPLQQAVQALQQESTACTQPMCETMGPKTDLGKFLKALNVAADVALIASLLSLNEAQLVSLIQSGAVHLAGVVGDVEQFIQPGGETIGGLITAAGGSVL